PDALRRKKRAWRRAPRPSPRARGPPSFGSPARISRPPLFGKTGAHWGHGERRITRGDRVGARARSEGRWRARQPSRGVWSFDSGVPIGAGACPGESGVRRIRTTSRFFGPSALPAHASMHVGAGGRPSALSASLRDEPFKRLPGHDPEAARTQRPREGRLKPQVTSSRRGFGRSERPAFATGLPSTRTTSAVKSYRSLKRLLPTP